MGLYLLAASLSARAAELAAVQREPREKLFWRVTAVLLVISAANELLDMQTLLTFIGRASARANGWYTERRDVQYAFLIALAGVGLLGAMSMLWLTLRTDSTLKLALVGLISTGLFVFLRAASIHHLDEVFARVELGFSWAWLAELVGILTVVGAAALFRRKR